MLTVSFFPTYLIDLHKLLHVLDAVRYLKKCLGRIIYLHIKGHHKYFYRVPFTGLPSNIIHHLCSLLTEIGIINTYSKTPSITVSQHLHTGFLPLCL